MQESIPSSKTDLVKPFRDAIVFDGVIRSCIGRHSCEPSTHRSKPPSLHLHTPTFTTPVSICSHRITRRSMESQDGTLLLIPWDEHDFLANELDLFGRSIAHHASPKYKYPRSYNWSSDTLHQRRDQYIGTGQVSHDRRRDSTRKASITTQPYSLLS